MRPAAIAAAGLVAAACVLHAQTPGKAPLRVNPEVMQWRLMYQVPPVYPKLAKDMRISGTVVLFAVIDEDGAVERLKLIAGHPLLVKAAFDAAKKWRYRPWSFHGRRVPVATTIRITFRYGSRTGTPPTVDVGSPALAAGVQLPETATRMCAR